MYADFFGLRELPFNNTPDPRFFYSTPDHEEALASLIYAVQQRKGFVLLTGEVGAGKTLVSRMMLRQFHGSIEFATINHAVESAADLMEAVCVELQLPVEPEMSNTQLVRQLHDFLLAKFAQNIPVVLVLDEAQNLPMVAFEQLRMIGNLESDDAKLLQICIVGQPELQSIIQSPQVRQLRQRIFRSFHLPALDKATTRGYLLHRLQVAGAADENLFSDGAVDAIYVFSRGLPRLINAVCDNSLLSAYSAGKKRVDETVVGAVVQQMMFNEDAQARIRPQPGSRRASREAPPAAPRGPSAPAAEPAHANCAAAGGDIGQVVHRVDAVEAELGRLRTLVAGAGTGLAGLADAGRLADSLMKRIQDESHRLLAREDRLEQLSLALKTVSAELARMLDRVKRSTALNREAEAQAQELQSRLTVEVNRAKSVLRRLQRSPGAAAVDVDRPQTRRVLAQARAPAPQVRPAADATLTPLMNGTQAAIDDLRSLAAHRELPLQAPLRSLAPCAGQRLADQAEDLLSLLRTAATI